ncbi:MAG: TerC family protein [Thermonemataceae bacterium]
MQEVIAHLLTTESLISLLTLTLLEVVLGIDNIVFISILSGRLPKEDRRRATNLGLIIAVIPRIALLFALSWMVGLVKPIFDLPIFGLQFAPSGRDLILLSGGLFLIYKSVSEIHQKLEGEEEVVGKASGASFISVITQITLLNVVFSFDSILTAIGLVDADKPENLWIMVLAVVFSMIIMIAFAQPVNQFVTKHPTLKMLALAFLLMIGTMLVMEGFHQEINKGYIYFAMAFSLVVELLNLRMKKKGKKVRLHRRYVEDVSNEGALLQEEQPRGRPLNPIPEEQSKAD